MAAVVSIVNSNGKDIDPIVNLAGTELLKQAKGAKSATGQDESVGAQVVAFNSSSATKANVAGATSSTTLLAANVSRIGAIITNDSSAILYIDLTGGTASTTSYSIVLDGAASSPFEAYEVPFGYTGLITGIWASATGNARVTEFVA